MDLSKQALDGDPRLIMTGTLVKVRRTIDLKKENRKIFQAALWKFSNCLWESSRFLYYNS